jgi:hypothetical protein
MNTYEQIQNVKDGYEKKAGEVRNNKDLSPSGRDKALAALKADKQAALKSFVPGLRKQAVETALRIKKLSGAQSALESIESEKLDYSRLTYEAQAVKSALILAGDDPYRVAEMFDAVKAGHDTYKIKAWIDQAPALMPEKSMSIQRWDELKADMAKSSELTRSAEASRYALEQRVHLDELADVSRVASIVADDLVAGSAAAYQGENVLQRVFEGITLDRQSGELHIDFGPTNDEMPEFTYQRLEAERAEREKAQGEVFKHFDVPYDPLTDGV